MSNVSAFQQYNSITPHEIGIRQKPSPTQPVKRTANTHIGKTIPIKQHRQYNRDRVFETRSNKSLVRFETIVLLATMKKQSHIDVHLN